MTLPNERFRALIRAKDFMMALVVPSETPGIPRAIRLKARSVLKHFPGDWELERIARGNPELLESELEREKKTKKQELAKLKRAKGVKRVKTG